MQQGEGFIGLSKYLLALMLLLSPVAFAQLDGGGGSMDLQTEDLEEDDHSGEVESAEKIAPNPNEKPIDTQPAPGTLDARPGSAPQQRSVGSGGVIFDWSKYPNAKEVPHPFAEKGLIRIDKRRHYIYKVDESEQKTAASVRFGPYIPQNLSAPGNDNVGEANFEDLYNQTDTPAVLVDWEWQLWRSPIGKFGATLGGGVYVAQGNGRFVGPVNSQNPDLVPKEIFTFAVVPMNIGAVYRMHIWDKQLLIPYAAGGGTIFGFSEFRDDDKAPKFGGSFGAYYAAGGAFNLTYFDNMSRIQLDREYGINAVYLTVEYRGIVALSKKFDFAGDMINGGFLMEY